MGVNNLRNLAVEWNHTAMVKLAQQDDDGYSLVSKGWFDKETYGQIFDETFQLAAIERIRQRTAVNEEEGKCKLQMIKIKYYYVP